MSRQHEWQKRQRALGHCIICGKDAVNSKRRPDMKAFHCEFHRIESNIRTREAQRQKYGWITRYKTSESYFYG